MRRRASIEAREAFLLARRAATASAVFVPRQGAEGWWINADTGSDANSGRSPTSPLKTWGQYLFYTGYEESFDNRQVDVFCTGTFPDSDPIIKRARTTGFNSRYGIHGTLAPQLTTLLTGFTASVPASNGRASFAVASGLTANMLGCRVLFPASNVYSQITSVNVGAQTATCLDPTSAPTTPTFPVRVTPSPGDPVIIDRGASAVLAIEWQSTTRIVGPGAFPGPFLLEGFSARQCSNLVKVCGNDNTVDPTIQFCQFQDVDVVADGVMLFRHNSFMVNGETTIRSRFDATQGVYLQNGNAFMAAPDASSPNCQLTGVEFATYFGRTCVNELGGNVNYQITHYFAAGGRLGWFITGSGIFGRVLLFAVSATLAGGGGGTTAEDFGSVQGSTVFGIGRETHLVYPTTRTCYALGAAPGGGSFSFVSGAGQNAWPALAANGSQAAQAALKTQADLNAAPFNGRAYDPTSLAALTTG